MTLDISSLELAIGRLDESLQHCRSPIAEQDPAMARTLRAGAVQAFEFTYELSWKMLKRFLAETEPSAEEIDALSFPDLIRLGGRRGLLLSDWETWKHYRRQRGITSHTYDPRKAEEVFAALPGFLAEARHLKDQLQARLAA